MMVRQPINTSTDLANAAIIAGIAVLKDQSTGKMGIAASGIADGISTSTTQADGDQVNYALPGSFCLAKMAAAVTDTTIPLKATTGGLLTPCTADKDAIVAWPMAKCANANSFIEVQVAKGYYTV
jgi:hypothetical protein